MMVRSDKGCKHILQCSSSVSSPGRLFSGGGSGPYKSPSSEWESSFSLFAGGVPSVIDARQCVAETSKYSETSDKEQGDSLQ